MASQGSSQTASLEDAFIKVTFEEDRQPDFSAEDPFYDPWVDHASSKFAAPEVYGARYLRKLYPKHTITLAEDSGVNLFGFPAAYIQPLAPSDLITSLYFVPMARRLSQVPGVLVDFLKFGSFSVAWDKYDFIVYVVKYPAGFGDKSQFYILHDGPEDPARNLLIAAGAWHDALHDEILVYNQGYWSKDHNLWTEVQKANWNDVILKDAFKASLKKDIFGFFDSEELYKSLSIPWKRGLIMYGPPGNGKTISMKAIMKEASERGYAPLYVKSFQSWMGEEGAMAMVFDEARQMAPCVVVLEDLDALINDRNRSFFLNQLDGLEGNDGLLVIGSTNHFDRLDPALNSRPSRFDRKYLFDDPDESERTLYVLYWQNKLKDNKGISFPDSLVEEIAVATDKFSFAYLKEAFVSTLVLLAGYEGDKPEFEEVLKGQIKSLKEQLDKDKDQLIRNDFINSASAFAGGAPCAFTAQPSGNGVNRQVSSRPVGLGRIWDAGSPSSRRMPGALPTVPSGSAEGLSGRRDVRAMASAAAAFGRSFVL